MSAQARIDAMEKFVAAVKERRSEIIDVLMWEICKNTADAVNKTKKYFVRLVEQEGAGESLCLK